MVMVKDPDWLIDRVSTRPFIFRHRSYFVQISLHSLGHAGTRIILHARMRELKSYVPRATVGGRL